ncbi:MAG TPA: ABC transporter substrate-binding protein/permease [Polyangia bacterium]|nr:ABC transporter substrate-binding protein/permease [Polyangia bacterium]
MVLASLAGCAPGPVGGLERVRRAGVLRWGADEQGGEPYAYEDPARPGHLVGFEAELADALAGALGVRAERVQNDWSTLVPSLERGTFDVALNGLEVTPARAARVAFTRPYYLFSERLLARQGDGRVRDLPSLRGLRVGTLASSQAWDLLLAAGAVALPYEGVDEPFADLAAGRTDAVLMDDIIADRYAPRHAGLRVVGDVAEGRYAAAVRADDVALGRALDDALATLIARGQLREILARYRLDGARQARLATETAPPPPPALSTAPRLDAHQIALFLQGALVTLAISTAAMALAVLLGLGLALARHAVPSGGTARRGAPAAFGAALATAYVEVFRGTPVLLQLFVIYYGLAPVLALSPWWAAILGLGLNYAAYEAEIYRAGLAAVPRGQMEAAWALGMSTPVALRRVVLPQALRIALPGMTNDFIALLKDSSLVSVITVVELTKRMTIAAVDLRGWLGPGLLCAALYFAMSYPLARLARRLERRLDGGH